MKTEKPLTKREKAKIWKAITCSIESLEFDEMVLAAAKISPEMSWPYAAYVARCVIAVRGMARKAKQPK